MVPGTWGASNVQKVRVVASADAFFRRVFTLPNILICVLLHKVVLSRLHAR